MSTQRETGESSWLSSAQVAALLRVHPKHVYRLLKRGLPGRRVGGAWRFRRDEVVAWSDAGSGPAPVEPPAASTPLPLLIAANGDLVIERLLTALAEGPGARWGFVLADRVRALAWLEEGTVFAAGSHGGAPPARAGAHRLARVHLVEREVGLVAKRAAQIPSLAGLGDLVVAVRPETAGVQSHLLEALAKARVSARRALAKGVVCEAHRDVVRAVLRGEAQVGLTTRAFAAAHNLAFRPIATESYGLLLRSHELGSPEAVRLCEVAQSSSLRAALGQLEGYDPSRCGDIRYDPDS